MRLGSTEEKTVRARGQQHKRQHSKTTICAVAVFLWPHSMDQLSKPVGISRGRASRVKRLQKPNNAEGKSQDKATRFCKARIDIDGS